MSLLFRKAKIGQSNRKMNKTRAQSDRSVTRIGKIVRQNKLLEHTIDSIRMDYALANNHLLHAQGFIFQFIQPEIHHIANGDNAH